MTIQCPHCQGTGKIEKPTIGELIKSARLATGLTYLELAKKGYTFATDLGKYELGLELPSILILYDIAYALNVKVRDLLPE